MLTEDQLGRFRSDGYLVVDGLLGDDVLDPVVDEYTRALDAAAQRLHALGRIDSTHADLPFEERYTALVTECPEVFYYLGISLPLDYETLQPEFVRVHTGPALFDLLRHDKLLDMAESVLGGEVALNPVLQVRLKPPQALLEGAVAEYSNIGLTTWHQDYGAVMDEAADTDMLTVWVAVTDATEDMGCLTAIPGSHLSEELTLHCPGRLNAAENYIPTALLERHASKPVPLPCTRGSVVLLTRFTEHAALPNTSERLRWSFDLRYQPAGLPTGRPAFPTFVLRSRLDPKNEVTDAGVYASAWEAARTAILSGNHSGPLYEQDRWLANRTSPLCA